MSYLSQLPSTIKDYFEILEPVFPRWLEEYIEVLTMLRSASISDSCGICYTALESYNFFFSNLDHSVAVALIVWHFTHNKEQTLAGLFHDIATPAFKHCIDVMNGDGKQQESLELLTSQFIENTDEIMSLLKRDHIKLEDIDNYHIYPIADNDAPRLAADRLEYSFSNALSRYSKFSLDDISELYEDIEIQENEDGLPELGFKTKKLARKFVKVTSEMAVIYRNECPRYSTHFIADVLKRLEMADKLHVGDLFEKEEGEILDLIEKSEWGDIFKKWRNAKKVENSEVEPEDVYWVRDTLKVRYIDPLVNGERVSKICKIAKRYIDKNLNYKMEGYLYIPGITFHSELS